MGCAIIGLMLIFMAAFCHGYTDPRDVVAINDLYIALGNPSLPGWIPNGGDPCVEAWQGIECVNSNITGIVLNGANLGGELSNSLQNFTSMIIIDLSDNHIGGSIPSNLPLTMRNFFLSANNFTGSIPDLSLLTQLTDMSLNNNQLSGDIPDAFEGLSGLVNLDLSGNNLSGALPPSMGNLSSLVTLHVQDNKLSGFLDVLQDLPLRDLNIENNFFSGPIPIKLLNIPNFKKDGNPFNTTIIPSTAPPTPSPSPLPPPPHSGTESTGEAHGKQTNGPFSEEEPSPEGIRKFLTAKKVVWIAIAGVLAFIVITLGLTFFMSRGKEDGQDVETIAEKHEMSAFKGPIKKTNDGESLLQPESHVVEVSGMKVEKSEDESGTVIRGTRSIAKPMYGEEKDKKKMGLLTNQEKHQTDTNQNMILMPPPPAHVDNAPTKMATSKPSTKALNPPTSVRSFTVGSLQQYTNNFSQDNLLGRGMFGSVYQAELPDGKLLAVKNLKNVGGMQQTDDEFLDLVSNISRLRHVNVLELVGYCAEHGQQLLIYEYCFNGTLHDALHSDDGLRKNFSWNARVQIALGAARAIEYLHEVCQPPMVHRCFRSTNILLDDKLAVRVSECGLASISQISGKLSTYDYEVPELEKGTYTSQSDVYSFGVVLLELLTGRKSYDRSVPPGEQFLVRWAIPQLHDINALTRMVDPSLRGAYPIKSLSRFADIISLCLQSEPEFRPPMSEIVQILLHMT